MSIQNIKKDYRTKRVPNERTFTPILDKTWIVFAKETIYFIDFFAYISFYALPKSRCKVDNNVDEYLIGNLSKYFYAWKRDKL